MRIKILTPCWNFTFAIEIAYKWNYSCVGVMCTHKIKLYIVHPELSYWPNAKKICTSQTSCQMNKTCGLELNWRQNCEAWICFRGVIVISHFFVDGYHEFHGTYNNSTIFRECCHEFHSTYNISSLYQHVSISSQDLCLWGYANILDYVCIKIKPSYPILKVFVFTYFECVGLSRA